MPPPQPKLLATCISLSNFVVINAKLFIMQSVQGILHFLTFQKMQDARNNILAVTCSRALTPKFFNDFHGHGGPALRSPLSHLLLPYKTSSRRMRTWSNPRLFERDTTIQAYRETMKTANCLPRGVRRLRYCVFRNFSVIFTAHQSVAGTR